MAKQPRGVRAFEEIIKKESFKEDFKLYGRTDSLSRITLVHFMILRYNLPSRTTDMLGYYLETGRVDYSLLREPVKVIRSDDGSVNLVLSHDITQPELKAFVEKHYSTEIRPLLENLALRRRRRLTVEDTRRDMSIYASYLNRRSLGLNIQGIALKHHVSKSTVERVVKKMKSIEE